MTPNERAALNGAIRKGHLGLRDLPSTAEPWTPTGWTPEAWQEHLRQSRERGRRFAGLVLGLKLPIPREITLEDLRRQWQARPEEDR
jgi:hypothetical protein